MVLKMERVHDIQGTSRTMPQAGERVRRRPEAPFLLRVASAFDELAIEPGSRESRLIAHAGRDRRRESARPCRR